ncbi:MAG: hypothetical protein WBP80_05685, partial [Planifilum fulgidum]
RAAASVPWAEGEFDRGTGGLRDLLLKSRGETLAFLPIRTFKILISDLINMINRIKLISRRDYFA